MVRIGLMTKRIFVAGRRTILAGLGSAAAVCLLQRTGFAQGAQQGAKQEAQQGSQSGPQRLALQAKESAIGPRAGEPDTPVWSLQATPPLARFKTGTLDVAFQNDLAAPAVINWHGIDGAAAAEPLTKQAPLGPGGKTAFAVTLRRPGTFLCDLRLLDDTQALPSRPLALVVEEDAPPAVDRDEVFLIEDWRLGAAAVYTVNGLPAPDIAVRNQERLRLRLINGCHRAVIAVKLEGFDVRVMALDGAPAEPFLARNSAVVLAPGGRACVLVDVSATPGTTSPILLHDGTEARTIARLVTTAEPPVRQTPLPPAPALPGNGLPAQLDLKNALRVELGLGGPEWMPPQSFAASAAPAFTAKPGRAVVLALTNRADRASVFHLHGHHFRLLDRLDDGWKPYWLDTLAIEPGQTQRVAFAAEYPGRWLLESAGTDWTSQRFVRWYGVN
jgi:FtsP/CotA-like multicopper oxidase with cupredoxin domain